MSGQGAYTSPPCMAAEVDPTYFDPLGTDAQQARDVARWRRAERARLASLREGLGQTGRAQVSNSICGHLETVLAARGTLRETVLAGYWPIRGEPDLRPILSDLHAAGVCIALPVVESRAAPLVFRRWKPEMRMLRGHWNIPRSAVRGGGPDARHRTGALPWLGRGLLSAWLGRRLLRPDTGRALAPARHYRHCASGSPTDHNLPAAP